MSKTKSFFRSMLDAVIEARSREAEQQLRRYHGQIAWSERDARDR